MQDVRIEAISIRWDTFKSRLCLVTHSDRLCLLQSLAQEAKPQIIRYEGSLVLQIGSSYPLYAIKR